MRVVVVGAGAMGSIFGAALKRAGNDVILVERDSAVVEQIRAAGLTIIDANGVPTTYPMEITDTPLGPVGDAVLFFVKGYQTKDAADFVSPLIGPASTLLTLQNGIGNEDTLRAVFASNAIVVGNSVHSATVARPGVVKHTGVQPTYIGPDATTSQEVVEDVARAFNDSGFVVNVMDRDEIVHQRWSKLVMNCATLPVGALTGLDTEPLGKFEPLSWLMDGLVHESCEVAQKEGVTLDPEERIQYTHGLLSTAGGRGSMTQDILLGRRTEIDTINGAVVRAALRHGIDAPLNRAMESLVRGRELAVTGGGKARGSAEVNG